MLVVEPNVLVHNTYNLMNYNEAYEKADVIVWLVRHKEFLQISKSELKIEFDFCGVRK